MTDIAQRTLASRLRLAVVRLNRRLRAQRSGEPVSLTQISALSTLYKCGPISPGKLAEREGVRPPSMTRVIATLQDRGYVYRSAHPSDGRQSVVGLTDSGQEYVLAAISAREAWLDRQLAALSDAERDVLEQASEIIARIAEIPQEQPQEKPARDNQ